MKTENAKLLYSPENSDLRFLPEGPYPLGESRFSWVAIQHGASSAVGSINVFDLATGSNTSYPLPGRPGFAFPTDHGNFVVGCERELGIYSPADGAWRPFASGIDGHTEGTIINDGVTWRGNLIFGTKDLEFKTKKAGLYFWRGRDKKLFQLRSDQICSNGKCVVEVDESAIDLYDIDSPTKRVVCYRINTVTGTIESERVVVDLANDIAVPDGMTMTPDGKSVVISLYNPNPAPRGRTVQYSIATGEPECVWYSEGSPQATCPQWVRYEGRVWLVITTAVEHMPAERIADSPNAGCLFLAESDWDATPAILDLLTPVFWE